MRDACIDRTKADALDRALLHIECLGALSDLLGSSRSLNDIRPDRLATLVELLHDGLNGAINAVCKGAS